MTNREIDILNQLARARQCFYKPIDLGGRDCSHHSRTLLKLTKQGLVERSKNYGHSWQSKDTVRQAGRGACVYRITEEGKRVHATFTREQLSEAANDPATFY